MKIISNEKGFTLIEVVIALGVFAIGIISFLVMQMSGIKGNATANSITSASVFAGDRIEQILAMDYEDPDLDPGTHSQTSPDGTYTITWTVEDDTPMDLTKKVQIQVSRLEQGVTRKVTYNYIKAWVVN